MWLSYQFKYQWQIAQWAEHLTRHSGGLDLNTSLVLHHFSHLVTQSSFLSFLIQYQYNGGSINHIKGVLVTNHKMKILVCDHNILVACNSHIYLSKVCVSSCKNYIRIYNLVSLVSPEYEFLFWQLYTGPWLMHVEPCLYGELI